MSGVGRAALAAALVWLAACAPGAEPLSAGPYVQRVSSSSAVVAAVTTSATTLRVRYGPAGGPLEDSASEPEPVSVHGLELRGLRPATEYAYELQRADGAPLGAGCFRTAPPDATARCTFLAVGDSGGVDASHGALVDGARRQLDELRGVAGDRNRQAAVARAMRARSPDLVLHTGDVVYPSGRLEDYADGFFRPFADLIDDVPLYATLGNHDVKTAGGRPLLDLFFLPENGPAPDERSYAFDWGCVHFVCLDVVSSPYDEGSAQLAWLADDLAASEASWKVAFFHYPPYSAHRDAESGLVARLVPALEAGGVDLVLSGHDHVYARFVPRGRTTYVVTGGGGKDLYSVRDSADLAYAESVFHFVEVVAEPGELNLRAIDAAGGVFDTLTIRKPRGEGGS